MNYQDFKNISIVDYLQSQGFTPQRIQYGSAWYLSPLRQEKTASFKVNLAKNSWYDFGSGVGGYLINLVSRLNHLDREGAIARIKSESYPSMGMEVNQMDDGSGKIRILRLKSLDNPHLIKYLLYRGVKVLLAKQFIQEAYYEVHRRKYYALAFKNDNGGYELRNAYFKTGSSPKYYTTINGREKSVINIFEGFMDFLSCCSYFNQRPVNTTIVLNSLSFLPRIEQLLKRASEIHLFLDNDEAGRNATHKITSTYTAVIDYSQKMYPSHKDFNEFLMARGSK